MERTTPSVIHRLVSTVCASPAAGHSNSAVVNTMRRTRVTLLISQPPVPVLDSGPMPAGWHLPDQTARENPDSYPRKIRQRGEQSADEGACSRRTNDCGA